MKKLTRMTLTVAFMLTLVVLALTGWSALPFGPGAAQAASFRQDDSEDSDDTIETCPADPEEIEPDEFVSVIDNPYMPLTPGTARIYESETEDGLERTEVTTLDETREVMGVTTIVVRDIVYLDGVILEDTRDWFAQDEDGNVWYFGEAVDNYEDGVLMDHEGSWEAGVDGALPGIVMFANPEDHLRESYCQEYYPDVAEDMAKVLSVNETVTVPYGTFENVLKTRDWTPLEPGVVEHKYYAKDVGLILEVHRDSGEVNELIDVISAPTDDDDD